MYYEQSQNILIFQVNMKANHKMLDHNFPILDCETKDTIYEQDKTMANTISN